MMIAEECARDLADEGASNVSAFYKHKGKWWAAADRGEVSTTLATEFEYCLKTSEPHRTKKSLYSNFPLPEVDAVIRACFKAALRQPRTEAIRRVIQRSLRNANNAFAVKYNPKTGLLAQDAFIDFVTEKLAEIAALGPNNAETTSDESVPIAVCLLAFDIDHFKQVNDSYGHAYGDLVIRAFAVRIDTAVKNFCSRSPGKVEAVCAHISGEEFLCVAWGPAHTSEFEGLAASILAAVRDHPLPSDDELELLSSTYSAQELTIPLKNQRNMYCSIGGIVGGAPSPKDSKTVAHRLINRADLALYKSKNQGRNRATFFPTILQSGGRVLEFKSDVSICIIDIGEEVGVMKGQEFIVLHPEFTGNTPYIVDDGRSKKTLGTLPKSALCTITAFDVQRQISFCRFSEDRFAKVEIPRNAVLEAIPLGTLSVAVSGISAHSDNDILLEKVATVADTQKQIAGEVPAESKVAFAIVGIRDENQMLSEYGPASINRGLAAACRSLQRVVTPNGFIGQLEATKLLLKYPSFSSEQRNELEEALKSAEDFMGGRVQFVAGVYSPDHPDAKSDRPPLPQLTKLTHRVDLARYAASAEAIQEGVRVQLFSVGTANLILTRLRQLREFKRGLADYQRFTEIGLSSPSLDNAAGLLHSTTGDYPAAEALYLKAAHGTPATEIVYRMNAIVMRNGQTNYDGAVELLEITDHATLEKYYKHYTHGTIAIAISLAEKAKKSIQLGYADRARLWVSRALALPDVPVVYKTRLQSLQDDLKGLIV